MHATSRVMFLASTLVAMSLDAASAETVVQATVEASFETSGVASVATDRHTDVQKSTRSAKRVGFWADHWEAGLGVQGSIAMGIGPIEAHEPVGLQLTAGRQIGSFRLAGDFSLVAFSGCIGREEVDGQVHRIGASARYRIPVGGTSDIFGRPRTSGVGFYVGGGLGRQSIRYVGGGHSARSDAMVELGIEFAAGKKRFAGFDLGIKVQAAQRPPVPVEVEHGSMQLVEDHTADLAAFGTMSLLFGG